MTDSGLYILRGRTPIRVANMIEWCTWLEKADRAVALTVIDNDEWVSTVFLGLDYQFGDGPPLLFETMVFGGQLDGCLVRYSTWEEAKAGHGQVVSRAMG